MKTDARKAAEEFIEKVVAPARAIPARDPEADRARAVFEREGLELVRAVLVDGGLDAERLDKLAAERSKARKKLAEESRRRAVDASAVIADRLKGLVPIVLPAEPIETVIDQVTFIRSFVGQGRVIDSNIGPADNWAQYRLSSSSDTLGLDGRLSFFTLWQNKQNAPTVLTVRPNLVVNAYLSCEADANWIGSWTGDTSQARATVRARTTVWSMDSSVASIVNDQVLEVAVARGNFWGDDSSRSIAFNELLPATGVTIAAQAYSLIEVELVTEWQQLTGSVELDAESGSHRVSVPQIVISELRTPEPPPISLTAGVDTATSPATVTLIWTGASGAMVDIYQNGIRLGDTENDGSWSFPINPGTHVFRVCETLSTVCSMDVTVTVT